MGYPKVYRLSNGGYVQFTAPNTTAKSIYPDGLHGAPKEKIGVSTWMESELGDAVLVYEHPDSPPPTPFGGMQQKESRIATDARCESGCATKPETAERGPRQEQLDRIQQRLLDRIEKNGDFQKQFISSEPSTMQHDEPLTKRERFAMEAMVAIIGKVPALTNFNAGNGLGRTSSSDQLMRMASVARGGVDYADALLAELAKEPA